MYRCVARHEYSRRRSMSTDTQVTEAPPEVYDFLASHNTLTLATASSAGLPHAATFIYVNDGLALYFWTKPDTTTAGHLAQNPNVSFAIDEYNADWTKMKGIQGDGECYPLLSSKD